MKLNKKRIFIISFFLILAFGIFFRVYRVEKTFNFIFDVEDALENTKNIIVNHKLTLIGPRTLLGLSSTRETYSGPLFYYLLAAPLILFKFNPIAAVLLTGLSNIIGGIFLFLTLRAIKKNNFTLIFFALYLMSPISVFL